mmetsp:Transcript_12954/g.54366  ORF Transcript_12954/g.54366 Transcript_12954/m.54366 type:complete len:554 (+) Transcript_12954:569-2230(+)
MRFALGAHLAERVERSGGVHARPDEHEPRFFFVSFSSSSRRVRVAAPTASAFFRRALDLDAAPPREVEVVRHVGVLQERDEPFRARGFARDPGRDPPLERRQRNRAALERSRPEWLARAAGAVRQDAAPRFSRGVDHERPAFGLRFRVRVRLDRGDRFPEPAPGGREQERPRGAVPVVPELALRLRRQLDVQDARQRRSPARRLDDARVGRPLAHERARSLELRFVTRGVARREEIDFVQEHDVGRGELARPRAVGGVLAASRVARDFRERLRSERAPRGGGLGVHDAHHAIKPNAREFPERLVQRQDGLRGVHQTAGLDEQVLDRARRARIRDARLPGDVQHLPHLRLQLAAEGAAQTPVRELHDVSVAAARRCAPRFARHELGVDVELGEIVHRARHLQILPIRQHVAHDRGLAAAEPPGDQRGGQSPALGRRERGPELVVAEQVHRSRLLVLHRGGRRFVGTRHGGSARCRDRSARRSRRARERSARSRRSADRRRRRTRQHAIPGRPRCPRAVACGEEVSFERRVKTRGALLFRGWRRCLSVDANNARD